jgi:PCFT/HCP family folate transporter-like MFS transporter 1/3
VFLSAENNDVQKDVQVLVNNFQMISQWIAYVPLIGFSIIAGALSDVFGRKPLILIPLIGYLLGSLTSIINYAFIDILPLEFFYLNRISSFFGGNAVYYLGIFSYASNVTNNSDRTYRMTRLDGMITLASMAGKLLSPYIFMYLGYYGNFISSSVFFALAIVYLILFVKEPIQIATSKNEVANESFDTIISPKLSIFQKVKSQSLQFLNTCIVLPVLEMKKFFAKDRKTIVKVIITLQLLCYGIYAFSVQVYRLTYLYMTLVFDGFTGTEYAHMTIVMDILRVFIMLIAMPIISGKYKIHDALLLGIFVGCEVVGATLKTFVGTLFQFYLAYGIGQIGYCKFAMVRCLLSKTVEKDEVGKAFALLAVVSSLTLIAGNPAFRQLYNETIGTFPSAIFLLFAALQALAVFSNFFVYFKRHEIKIEDNIQPEEDNQIKETKK